VSGNTLIYVKMRLAPGLLAPPDLDLKGGSLTGEDFYGGEDDTPTSNNPWWATDDIQRWRYR